MAILITIIAGVVALGLIILSLIIYISASIGNKLRKRMNKYTIKAEEAQNVPNG